MTEKEKLLNASYDKFMDIGLSIDPSLDDLEELAVVDVMGFGTAVDEKLFTLSALRELLITQEKLLKGVATKWERTLVLRRISADGNSAVFADDIIGTMMVENETMQMYLRFSCVMEFIDNKWMLVHWHGSKPENVQSEVDGFGIDKWKQRNAELEKLVDEKTADLIIKNRELEIENSLERVRAIALSMKEPTDMLEVCRIISQQSAVLGISEIRNVQTVIINEQKGTYVNYQYFAAYDQSIVEEVDYHKHPTVKEMAEKMISSPDAFFTGNFIGKELEKFRTYRKLDHQLPDPILDDASTLDYYFYSIGPGGLGLSTYKPLSEAGLDVFKQFHKVFSLAYRRFLDIEKAIAQAKEARLETAMERVRAVAMAMRKPDDLLEICKILYEELNALGLTELRNAMINIHNDEKGSFVNYDFSNFAGAVIAEVSYNAHPAIEKMVKKTRSTNDAFIGYTYEGKDLEDWKVFRKKGGEYDDSRVENTTALYYYFYSIGTGSIGISAFNAIGEEKLELLKRFRNVFNLSYQRFMDITLAEAQAREAKIENALEKVRSKTMAMQRSGELAETATVLFQQFKELGEAPDQITIGLMNESENVIGFWIAKHNGQDDIMYNATIDEPNLMNKLYVAWKKQKKSITVHLSGKELSDYVRYRSKLCGVAVNMNDLKGERFIYAAFFSKGLVTISTPDPRSEQTINLLERFAGVFDGTYTRFLDLKRAEAQARESQIEAALERVRSRAMAMQTSEELNALIGKVFTECTKLDLILDRCILIIYDPKSYDARWWMANSEAPEQPVSFLVKYHKHKPNMAYFNAWKQRILKWQYTLEGTIKKNWDEFLFSETELSLLPDFVKAGMQGLKRVFINASFNNFGSLTLSTLEPLSDEHFDILLRFAKVFDLTYTRFNDLQLAESQTREAKIETALERVRGRALAMQSSDELIEVANVLREQMGLLGQPELEASVVHLYEKDPDNVLSWYAFRPGGEDVGEIITGTTLYHKDSCELVREMVAGFHGSSNNYTLEASGYKQEEWLNVLFTSAPPIKEYMVNSLPKHEHAVNPVLPKSYYHLSNFSGGALLLVSLEKPLEEACNLQRRAATVFDLAYRRFLDLQYKEEQSLKLVQEKQRLEQTLSELRATQSQLIQSEKMASLGELTAGIAHEIQNPLNFVNNFSEVSGELLAEMDGELDKGDIDEAKAIAADVRLNLEKINHHGKRASDIVKGMLQHSRTSSGQKEPTDINALADEYLRLAYHGLRAKDKSFNADFKTEFDESLPKINVIPQDIGRVLLNLINNAFYAVDKKGKENLGGYKPVVIISTASFIPPPGGPRGVKISIKDNGSGIPSTIKEKIFQPFFTTKPTGQGTGLGLSLSYDIVNKGHGGELKVETTEGEGTIFTILLPDQNDK